MNVWRTVKLSLHMCNIKMLLQFLQWFYRTTHQSLIFIYVVNRHDVNMVVYHEIM